MRTVIFEYPSDPPERVQLMTGAEFNVHYPEREVIIQLGQPDERRFLVDEIVCDACNSEILPAAFCAVTRHRAYCVHCYTKYYAPYVRDGGV